MIDTSNMPKPDWVSADGTVVLYCRDCRDVLPYIPTRIIGIVVTDPPYGIGYEASRYANAAFAGVIDGDDDDYDPAPILSVPAPSVIWGANNFAERLPRGGWLCWDKRCGESADKILGSPFELAWCSIPTKFRMIRLQHGGAVNADGRVARVHPTQKPMALMRWCIDLLGAARTDVVADPYMGSGTTGVACVQLGRQFVGIEKDADHFLSAVRRIERAFEDGALYSQPARIDQPELIEGAT